ncbi:putative cytochrome P450 CYP5325A1 [Rosellinia necatrix]|uniref:Putative cytochrome P450 CYP5325A1 n=1 Tax=Rosellinia necatrix TaxID=77044 RepID=A0A1S8A815_ROSNE|nr:putative cytochrome P450 CYP5325A1 [Rosellinia necatrix]
MAKIPWTFDMQVAPGQKVNLETDLKAWGYWVKPELRVRFLRRAKHATQSICWGAKHRQ